MDLGSSELNSEAFFWGRQVSAQRAAASFARLWAVQIMAHSALTLSMLRRRNWRKPLACLIALDPASDERAKIGLRAIARIGRCFIRVLPEIGFYGIEQWCKLRLIARRVGQRVRHDDLTGAIDGGLCVVALDEAVFGRHHAAVGIGEVALRLVARLCRDGLGLASRPALAAVAGAVVVRLRGSFGFGFSFQRGLGGPGSSPAASLCWPSTRASRRHASRLRADDPQPCRSGRPEPASAGPPPPASAPPPFSRPWL